MSFNHRSLIYLVLLCVAHIMGCISAIVLPVPSYNQTSIVTHSLGLDLLGVNVAAELRTLAQQPDVRVSLARLFAVRLSQTGRDPWLRSSDITAFERIILALRGPPSAHGPGEYFYVLNKAPQYWDRWTFPFFHLDDPTLSNKNEIFWTETQQSMSIRSADRILKRAGYRGTFTGVQIAAPQGEHVSYCFAGLEVLPGINHAVVVEVLSGDVREVPNVDCP